MKWILIVLYVSGQLEVKTYDVRDICQLNVDMAVQEREVASAICLPGEIDDKTDGRGRDDNTRD